MFRLLINQASEDIGHVNKQDRYIPCYEQTTNLMKSKARKSLRVSMRLHTLKLSTICLQAHTLQAGRLSKPVSK